MWTILLSLVFPLWSKFKEWIIGAAALVTVLVGVYAKGRMDQSAANAAKEAKQHVEDLETSRKINEDVGALSDADVDRELSKFVRHK